MVNGVIFLQGVCVEFLACAFLSAPSLAVFALLHHLTLVQDHHLDQLIVINLLR